MNGIASPSIHESRCDLSAGVVWVPPSASSSTKIALPAYFGYLTARSRAAARHAPQVKPDTWMTAYFTVARARTSESFAAPYVASVARPVVASRTYPISSRSATTEPTAVP